MLKAADAAKHFERLKQFSGQEIITLGASMTDGFAFTYFKILNQFSPEQKLLLTRSILQNSKLSLRFKLNIFEEFVKSLSDQDREAKAQLLYLITANLPNPPREIVEFNAFSENFDGTEEVNFFHAYLAAAKKIGEIAKQEEAKQHRAPLMRHDRIRNLAGLIPPFPKLQRSGDKSGGANVGGENTGLYSGEMIVNENTLEEREEFRSSLIKQDYKNGKLRINKIIGECVGGSILRRIYHDHLGAKYDQFAEVRLIRDDSETATGENPDETGEHVYLQSIYIKNYKHDLWKYAYYKLYKDQNIKKINEDGFSKSDFEKLGNELTHRILKLEAKYKKTGELGWRKSLEADAQYRLYQTLHEKITQSTPEELNAYLNSNKGHGKKLAAILARVDADNMKRPSGVKIGIFEPKVRSVIDDLIKNNDQLLQDFATMAAPRLLIGDFGLHNGNFGLARIDGVVRLVSLDYGAAFLNPISNVNPYTTTHTGIEGPERLYKNHFLEFSKEVNASVYMAKTYIKLGQIKDEELRAYVAEIVNSQINENLGINPLKEFCKRLKMDRELYEDINDKGQVLTVIREFLITRLSVRKKALQDIGYGLLLEHCFNRKNNSEISAALRIAAQENPGLAHYIQSDAFTTYQPILSTTPKTFKNDAISLSQMQRGPETTAPMSAGAPSASAPTTASVVSSRARAEAQAPEAVDAGAPIAKRITVENAKVLFTLRSDDTTPKKIRRDVEEDDDLKIVQKHLSEFQSIYDSTISMLDSLKSFAQKHIDERFMRLIETLSNLDSNISKTTAIEYDDYLAGLMSELNFHADELIELKNILSQLNERFLVLFNSIKNHATSMKSLYENITKIDKGKPNTKVDELLEKVKLLSGEMTDKKTRRELISDIKKRIKAVRMSGELKSAIEVYVNAKEIEMGFDKIDARLITLVNAICDAHAPDGNIQDELSLCRYSSGIKQLAKLAEITDRKRATNEKIFADLVANKAKAQALIDVNLQINFNDFKSQIAEIKEAGQSSTLNAWDRLKQATELSALGADLKSQQDKVSNEIRNIKSIIIDLRSALPHLTEAEQTTINDLIARLDQKHDALQAQLEADKQPAIELTQTITETMNSTLALASDELTSLRGQMKAISEAISTNEKSDASNHAHDSASIELADRYDFANLHAQFMQISQMLDANADSINTMANEKALDESAKNLMANLVFLQSDIKAMLTFKSIGKSLPTRIVDDTFNQFGLIEQALVKDKNDSTLLTKQKILIEQVASDLKSWSLSLPVNIDKSRTNESFTASLALQQFVKEQIFSYRDITARTQALNRWINILKTCEANHDYHSVHAIATALKSPEIQRLEFTWLGLPDESTFYWNKLSNDRLLLLPFEITPDDALASRPTKPSVFHLALQKATVPDATLLYQSKNAEEPGVFTAPTRHFNQLPDLPIIIFNGIIAQYLSQAKPHQLPKKIPSPEELNRLSLPHEIKSDVLTKALAKFKVKISGNVDEVIRIITSLTEPTSADSLLKGLAKAGITITKEQADQLLNNKNIFPDLSCESILKGIASANGIHEIDLENRRLRNLVRTHGYTDKNHQRDYLTLLTKLRDRQLKPIDIAELLSEIRDNLTQKNPSMRELRKLISDPITRDIILSDKSLLRVYNQAIDASMQLMADTLIKHDHELMSNLDTSEMYLDNTKEPAPTLAKSIQYFNQVSQFVIQDIISVDRIDDASQVIEYWIRVMDKCINHPTHPDTNMAIAIHSALTNSAISRLKPAFTALTPEAKDIFNQLEKIFDSSSNYKSYREYINDKSNSIPYIGIYLTDATFYREGNPIVETIGFANYAQAEPFRQKLRSTLTGIRKTPKLKGESQPILTQVTQMSRNNDNEFYQRSLALLPRDISASLTLPNDNTTKLFYSEQRPTTKTQPKSDASSVNTVSEAKKALIILNKNNISQLPLLKELMPHAIFAYHHHEGEPPAANVDINFKTTQESITASLKEYRQYFIAEGEPEEIKTQRKIELFYLVKYGHFSTHDISTISTNGRTKILQEIAKPDFVESYLEKFKSSIIDDFIAQSVFEQARISDADPLSMDDVLYFETYSRDLFTGKRHHLISNHEMTDDPSHRKAYAAVLFALLSPDYFKSLPDQPIDPRIIANRTRWIAIHLNRVSAVELEQLWIVLNKPNPETNKIWLEQLPLEIQQLITNKHQNTIATFVGEPNLHELTPHIAKSMNGYTQAGDAQTYSAKYSVRVGDETALREVEVHLDHERKPAISLTNFVAGRLMTALVGDASSPVVLTTAPSKHDDSLLLPDYSGEKVKVGFLTNQRLQRFAPELKSLTQLPSNMQRVNVASFLLGDFSIDESNYLLTDKGILKAAHDQTLDNLDDNIHLHRKITLHNDFKKLPVKTRISKEYADQFKKIGEFPQDELKAVIDASLKEAAEFYSAKQFFEFAKHVGVNINDLKVDWNKIDAKKDQEIKEEISNRIGVFLNVKLEKRQASCKKISLEISVSLCFNDKGKITNSNELKRLIQENPDSFSAGKFHFRGEIDKSVALKELNAFAKTINEAKVKRQSMSDTAGMTFQAGEPLPSTGDVNPRPEVSSAASVASGAGASAPEQRNMNPPRSSTTSWQRTAPSATLFKQPKKSDASDTTLSLSPTDPSLSKEQSLQNMILTLDNIIGQIKLINRNIDSIENTVRQSRSL